MFVNRTGLVRAPNCCVLLPTLGVIFHSHEALGRQRNLFVVDEIEYAPKNDQNVGERYVNRILRGMVVA
jgi:hypothetical protein